MQQVCRNARVYIPVYHGWLWSIKTGYEFEIGHWISMAAKTLHDNNNIITIIIILS